MDALEQYSFRDFPTDKIEAFSHLEEHVKLKVSCSSKKYK